MQDAFTSCQGLQLICHTTGPTLLGWTVLTQGSPLLQLHEGPGWQLGCDAASSDSVPSQQPLGQRIEA